MTSIDKPAFVTKLRAHAFAMAPELRHDRLCLLYSALGAVMLQRQGVHAVVQAGSASWLYKAHDDGGTTHYSYVFDISHPRSAQRLAMGGLPEMHCWIGLPATQEIVDVTTRHLPALTQESTGEIWTTPAPPDFFWDTGLNAPTGWRYWCEAQAVFLAFQFIARRWPDLFRELRDRRTQAA